MHKFRLTLALFALLLAFDAVAQGTRATYRWRNVAIGGGGFVSGLVFHPLEKDLLYARTDIGGAYRWLAEEKRWQPLLDWMGAEDAGRFGVESIALDPSDPERVYLAVGTYLHERGSKGAILRSSDRGRTFQRTALPFKLGGNEQGRGNGERLAVDPNDGRVLFFGTRAHGLWRSDDRGANWREVPGFPVLAKSPAASIEGWNGSTRPMGVAFVVFDPTSGTRGTPSHTLYAGISTSATSLYRSDDGGETWRALPGQPVGLRPNHMVRDARGRWLLSYGDKPGPDRMHGGALWRFDPADGSWADIPPAPQSTDDEGDGFGWGAVATDARDANVIIASTFTRYQPHDELFRSVDGGKTWKPTIAGAHFERGNAPWTRDTTPHWLGDVEIDPHDPDRVLFVTGYGLWASRNARAFDQGEPMQWEFPLRGFEETVPLVLLSPPQGAHLISGLGDVDGFVHDTLDVAQDRFASVRYSNTEGMAFAARAPHLMARTGHYHDKPQGAVRAAWSQDGGRTWRMFAGEPPGDEGQRLSHVTLNADGTRVILQWRNGSHWLTEDFGKRWQAVRGLAKTAAVEADPVEAHVFHAFDTAGGTLYRSEDGGESFAVVARIDGETGGASRAELHPDPQHGDIWIAASSRGLLHWSQGRLRRLPGVDSARSLGLGKPVRAGAPRALFLFGEVAGKLGLYRPEDAGRNWERIDDDAHRFGGIIRHVTGDPRLPGRVYFGTEGRGIWYGDPQ